MADPLPTKAELMAEISSKRAELEALIDAVPSASRETAGSTGWGVKDHMVHVAAWEKSLLALLAGEDRAGAVGIDRETYASLDTDGINERVFEAGHIRPYADVARDFDETHGRVLAALAPMKDEDLARGYSHYQPNVPPENTAPVVGWIVGNTSDHYDEHIGWLKTLREELGV